MRKLSNIIGAFFLLLAAIVPANCASAAGYNVIHTFCAEGGECPNGSNGFGLVRDDAGNLYGVARGGVPYPGVGIIFELSPNASTGKWAYRVIHTFCQKPDCKDSDIPSSSLIIDKVGNLYSTTLAGNEPPDAGVVYKLSPNADRSQWSYTILARFGDKRGWEPFGDLSYFGKSAGLPYDGVSPLYGETSFSEKTGFTGSIYELRPASGTPAWKFNTVHLFCATDCMDGEYPGPVTVDSSGNLYGIASGGGPYGAVLIFRFSPKPNNTGWKRTMLHAFCATEGCPDGRGGGSLVLDTERNLFGIGVIGNGACSGSTQGCNMIFRLSPDGHEEIVYKFCRSVGCPDGTYADYLIGDGTGNLYGTTSSTAFVLRKNNTLKTLLTFCAQPKCGGSPVAIYSPTELVGSTYGGGLYGQGAIFEITHNTLP